VQKGWERVQKEWRKVEKGCKKLKHERWSEERVEEDLERAVISAGRVKTGL
jgi:hypothetical protein